MLELNEALSRVLDSSDRLPIEKVGLGDLNRRVLAESLVSPLDLPVADNSSMDGYAVLADDLKDASEDHPVELTVVGSIPAGEVPSCQVSKGNCVRLFTGSFLPPGADAVIMQEDTVSLDDGQRLQCLDAVKPWENVRFRGEDVKQGASLVDAGTRLKARHIGLIAAVGASALSVSTRPRVGILATGHELQEAGSELKPGAIFESNRVMLAELIKQVGGVPRIYPLVDDTMEATTKALRVAAEENDAVVTSGGVSVGDYDLIRPGIEALGGTIDFWRVRLRPGKPFVYAHLAGKPLFGLPGNPVSAVTTFMVLVRPALLCMQGAASTDPVTRTCQLRETISNRGDRPHYYRIQIDESQGISSAGLQGSHALQSLSQADGWLRVDAGQTLASGDVVPIMVWDE